MTIRLSYYNQFREHGRLPRCVWLHRDNDTARTLGYVLPLRWGAWEVRIDNNRGGQAVKECRTLKQARAFIFEVWWWEKPA